MKKTALISIIITAVLLLFISCSTTGNLSYEE